MPFNNQENFWFPGLVAAVNDRVNGNIDDAQYQGDHGLNADLTALPFGATPAEVLGALRAHGREALFPAGSFDNFAGFVDQAAFDAWQQGELAQMKLRRLYNESIDAFDIDDGYEDFVEQIGGGMAPQQVRDGAQDFLVTNAEHGLQAIINAGDPVNFPDDAQKRANECKFVAIANAFNNEGMYAFTPEHKWAFVTALITGPNAQRLSNAGVSRENISAAIVDYLPFVENQAQFTAILDAHHDAGGLLTGRADLAQAIERNLPLLFEKGIGYAGLIPHIFTDDNAFHNAVLRLLAVNPIQMTPVQFNAIFQALYTDGMPLEANRDAVIAALIAKITALGGGANPNDILQQIAGLLNAAVPQGQVALRGLLGSRDEINRLLSAGITLAQIAEATRGFMNENILFNRLINDAANLDALSLADIQHLQAHVAADRFSAAIVARLNDMVAAQAERLINLVITGANTFANVSACLRNAGDAGIAALRAQLRAPAKLEALLQARVTLTDIAAADAEQNEQQLFAPIIAQVAAADFSRVRTLQALIGTAAVNGPGFSQKEAFDRAVAAQAGRLLAAAADEVAFTAVADFLRTCDTGNVGVTALNNYTDTHIVDLLRKNIPIAIIVANGTRDAAGVCAEIVHLVETGAITAPADLVRAQNAIHVAGQDLAAFRVAVAGRIDPLFNAMTTAVDNPAASAAYTTIRDLVTQHTVVNDPLMTAFAGKLAGVANAANLRALTDKGLMIGQIELLVTGQEAYLHQDNVAFRQIHLDGLKAKLKAYLDSVKPEGAGWKHDVGAGEVACTEAAIKTKLAEYRAQFEKFNESPVAAELQSGSRPHSATTHHGTSVLQNFAVDPAVVAKLNRIYGDADHVRSEFTKCNLTREVSRQALTDQIITKINNPTTLADLNSIVNEIHAANDGIFGNDDELHRAVTQAAKQHLLSPDGALLMLLEGAVVTDPEQIVTLCNNLVPGAPTSLGDLQAALKAAVEDLLAPAATVDAAAVAVSQAKLVRVLEVCAKYPVQLKAKVIECLRDNFLQFVATGLIADANFDLVKNFLDVPVSASANLVTEVTRRRAEFFDVRLAPGTVGRDVVLKEFKALLAANEKVASGEFSIACCGDLANTDVSGHLDKLLAHGLTCTELAAAGLALTDIELEQLREKVQIYVTAQVTAISTKTIDPAMKDQVRREFGRLVLVFKNMDNVANQDVVKTLVRGNAVALLRRGVSVNDLMAIDATLMVDGPGGLSSRIMADASIPVAEQESLLREIRIENVNAASATIFFDSLSDGRFKDDVKNVFVREKIPELQRTKILAQAFDAIKSKFAANIDHSGKFTDSDPSIWHNVDRALRVAINAALTRFNRVESQQIQARQGLSLAQLSTKQATRQALQDLAVRVNQIKDAATRTKIMAIGKAIAEYDRLTQVAAQDGSEEAYDALVAAKAELDKYTDTELDFLTAIYAKDREELAKLATEVDDKLIAIDILIGADSSQVFANALLAKVREWPARTPADQGRMIAVLQEYLTNPVLLLHGEFRKNFAGIIAKLGLPNEQVEDFKHGLAVAIQHAEAVTISAISTNLENHRVTEADSIYLFTNDEREKAAKQLWNQRLELASVKQDIKDQLNNPHNILQLKTEVARVKTEMTRAVGVKGDRTTHAGKRQVVVETAVALTVGQTLTPDNIRALFPVDEARLSARVGSSPTVINTAKLSELTNRQCVAKLNATTFTTFETMSASGVGFDGPAGVYLGGMYKVTDRAAGATAPVDVTTLTPDEYAAHVVAEGELLAQFMLDRIESDGLAKFRGNSGKTIEIGGDFKKAGRAGQFEVDVMTVAMNRWRQRGCSVVRNDALERHAKAVSAQGNYLDKPEFKRAMQAAPASVPALKARGARGAGLKEQMEKTGGDLRRNFRP